MNCVASFTPALGKYDDVVNHPLLAPFKQDKIKLAHAVAEILDRKNIDGVLDLRDQLERLSARIENWNGIST